MCSVGDPEADGVSLMEKKNEKTLIGAKCRKCEISQANVVLQSKFPYCRDCFLVYLKHKFFSTIGKSKMLKPSDKVLVASSGSMSSTALLYLVKEGQDDERRKKLGTDVIVLHIDESQIFETSKDKRELLEMVKRDSTQLGFPVYFSSINLIDDANLLYDSVDSILSVAPNAKIQQLYSTLSSISSKLDMLLKLRATILYQAAVQLNCSKIFTAETSDHLAVTILSNIALGRGIQLPIDIGFCDNRFEIPILRPLREVSKKEVAYYCVFNGIEIRHSPKLDTMEDAPKSIQKLTEQFVMGLQGDFPSTVPTIIGTGNKLGGLSKIVSDRCLLCKGPIENYSLGLSALAATRLSKQVSSYGPKDFDSATLKTIKNDTLTSNECCGSKCSKACKITSESNFALESRLCYGCSLILNSDPMRGALWPLRILQAAQSDQALSQMREEIKDFLIE